MRSVAIALIVVLAGCASSPPTRFYTLDPIMPAGQGPVSTPLTLQVASVHLPAVLDRQEMVRESAPETLQLSDRNRWGAPLGGMMRRVLSQDLAARLPAGAVLGPDASPPAGAKVLVVDVLRFDAGPSGTVALEGSWTLFAAGSDRALLTRPIRLASSSPVRSYHDQAIAMSRLLGRLADQIAESLGAQNQP